MDDALGSVLVYSTQALTMVPWNDAPWGPQFGDCCFEQQWGRHQKKVLEGVGREEGAAPQSLPLISKEYSSLCEWPDEQSRAPRQVTATPSICGVRAYESGMSCRRLMPMQEVSDMFRVGALTFAIDDPCAFCTLLYPCLWVWTYAYKHIYNMYYYIHIHIIYTIYCIYYI